MLDLLLNVRNLLLLNLLLDLLLNVRNLSAAKSVAGSSAECSESLLLLNLFWIFC
jgi:hypothetical protein